MDLFHYDPEEAKPLDEGDRAYFVPIQRDNRLAAMLLMLDNDGDTGQRALPTDSMLVVIAGEGQLRSGGQVADLRSGTMTILPGGVMFHIWTSTSRLHAALVNINT